ncbi:MAG TPA: hypothetical protein GXZ30_05300 [Propionibacterium sp.]|nr:hypothetical protein [Propionibacterium sp.]
MIDLVTGDTTFADHGRPEWGRIKLVVSTPDDSVTGALGFISLTEQVAGGQGFPPSAVAATPEQRRMPSVEWRVVDELAPHEVLDHLAPHSEDAPRTLGVGPRVGVTSEVVAVNRAEPNNLQAWHLDGARRGVRLAIVGGGTPTIDSFIEWLDDEEGEAALLAAGVRVGDRAPSADFLQPLGLPTEGVSEPDPLTLLQWATATQAYATFSHRTATMTVVDASAAMNAPLGNSSDTKMELIASAATETWSKWPPGSVTGLMAFQTDRRNRPVFAEKIPLQPNDTPEFLANLETYTAQFGEVRPSGGAPLYDAVWHAYSTMEGDYRPGFSNGIVILTNGRNDAWAGSLSEQDLVERLQSADPTKRIDLVFVVLSTDTDDYAPLERIAAQTGNRAWQVSSQEDVSRVIEEITIAFANN